MDVSRIQRALAEMRKQAGENKVPDAGASGELIDDITAAIGDVQKQADLNKAAYLRHRSNVLVAKALAGIDALASQRGG